MAANVVSAYNMGVGKKNGGKHWTRNEVDKRQKAAEKIKRKKVTLTAPSYIKNDIAAYKVWQQKSKQAKDLELLDDLCSEVLGKYCMIESQIEKALDKLDIELFEKLSRLSLQYANKLGFTPEAMARLAKKKAEKEVDPNADLFD